MSQQWPPNLQLEHQFDLDQQQPAMFNFNQYLQQQAATQQQAARNPRPIQSVPPSQGYQQQQQQQQFYGAPMPYAPTIPFGLSLPPDSSPSLTDGGLSPTFVTSPDSMHPQPPPRFSFPNSNQHPSPSSIPPPLKRQREEEDHLRLQDPQGQAKPKPLGACARCKNLKVRCEFKSENDPCKRCMNGGHDCVIPGRKKRRTPPKREHLLNQIRDQAAQIQKLMAQLDISKAARASGTAAPGGSSGAPVSAASDGPDLLNPVLDDPADAPEDAPTPEVEDWLTRARESIDAFDGFISTAGAGLPKSLVVAEDPEDSGDDDSDDEFAFAVVDDGDDPAADDGFERADADGNTGAPLRRVPSAEDLAARSPSEKLAALPGEATPFGLFARLASRGNRGRQMSTDEGKIGLARGDFFRPRASPDPERRVPGGPGSEPVKVPEGWHPPHILTRGIVTPDEAEKLFAIYFDYMNISLSLLDPALYTAQKTCWRSPFLFTVICAVAARHYAPRPGLYRQVMHYAQLAAGTALISAKKSVELVFGYILLSLYPVPARKWEDDRSWLYLGLALRVATDLNLHHPSTATPRGEAHAREMLNRARAWLNCFNLDRSTGSQYGKPPIVKNSDYIANHSEDWWKSSPYNMQHFDIHICCYNAELKVMARFQERIYSNPSHPTGLNKEVDFTGIASETDDKLKSLGEEWFARIEAQPNAAHPQNAFRTGLLKLAYSYARLIALSFGFQHAFGKNLQDENPFLLRCLRAASDVVNTFVDNLGKPSQRIYLRHGPDAQSVFVTFASSFLVKLLQPKFASYLTHEQRLEIRALVQKVVDLLGSPEIAVDDRHGPKLYSRFLKGLLATPMARVAGAPSSQKQKVARTQSGPASPMSTMPATLAPVMPQSSATMPNPQHATLYQAAPPSPQEAFSPASTASLSPPPNQELTSFDHFAPVGAGIDPFVAHAIGADMGEADYTMNVPEFYSTPLPFDDILSSMADPNVWPEMAMPGFGWMSQMQPQADVAMKNPDGMNMYTNTYGSQ